MRQRASELLGDTAVENDDGVIDALVERALSDSNRRVREAAVSALDALGPEALDRLISRGAGNRRTDGSLSRDDCRALLTSDRPELRLAALHGLQRLGDRKATPLVVAALEDEDQRVRWRACHVCGSIGDPRAVGSLIDRLTDDSVVQQAAILALGQLGTERATAALVPYLEANDPDVRRHSARALGIARASDAIEPLIARIDDEHDPVRAVAFRAVMEVLPAVSRERRHSLREEIIERIGDDEPPGAREHLQRLASEGRRPTLQREAITVLGEITTDTDRESIDALAAALAGDDVDARTRAQSQLSRIGGHYVRRELLDQLDRNPDIEERAAIAAILGRLGDPRVTERLERLTGDEAPEVRAAAYEALEQLAADLDEDPQ